MPPLIRLLTTGLAATMLLFAAEPVTINLLPPGPGNPRNTEGDFVRLKDGRILFIYSRFSADGPADSGPASLAARYSSDEGRTWTDTDEPVVANEGGIGEVSQQVTVVPGMMQELK